MKAPKPIRRMGMKAWQVILFMALVSGLTSITAAQEKAKTGIASTPAKSQTGAKPRGGPQEGITVHGHWVIEVRNPNGTLAARREFENSLVNIGKSTLVRLLSRTGSAGLWEIVFDGGPSGANGGCGAQKSCAICEATPASIFAETVIVGTGITRIPLPVNVSFPTMLQLKGTGTATEAGTISRVFTRLGICSNTDSPAAPCALSEQSAAPELTEALAGSGEFQAASIAAGQIVQITVTFSFS
jgi:hypothetical protein